MSAQVKLIGLTVPEEGLDLRNSADIIAYCARVSNPANQSNKDTAGKLLSFLIKEGHWSPFEMVSLTMKIVSTRDIIRQVLRHRSFSFQEFSQRYAEVTEFTSRPARLQDMKNRQNSVHTDDEALQKWWADAQDDSTHIAEKIYREALAKGIAKEQARAVLPEGLAVSTVYMAGTLRSWIHYCQLRRGNGTQQEHIEIADKCWEILKERYPDVCEAAEYAT